MKAIPLFIVVMVSLFANTSVFADAPPDWNKISTVYMHFAGNAHPTDEDGRALLNALPSTAACDGSDTAIPDLMIDSMYFQYLSKQAYAGNSYAAEAMFKLSQLVCADAEHSEFMDISIGQLIKPQPALFLALLEKYKRKDLSGLLGNLGDAFVDKPAEEAQELKLRYVALASVKSGPNEIQQDALTELKNQIAQAEAAAKQN